jgi:Bacterial regulatory helix-turn-helix protein, lysR family
VVLVDFDLAQVRAFVAVTDDEHFGRAAARLHLSQQAISRRIQRLEQLLGAPLFVRGINGAELTPTGLGSCRSPGNYSRKPTLLTPRSPARAHHCASTSGVICSSARSASSTGSPIHGWGFGSRSVCAATYGRQWKPSAAASLM